MGLALAYLSLVLWMIASMALAILPKNDSIERLVGGYSPVTSSLINRYAIASDERIILDDNRSATRNANIAAIRVCRELSYEMKEKYRAGDMTCSGYGDSTTLYSFIAVAGTTGSLDTLYSNTSSSTLSCAQADRYGRYLFSRSLPQTLISGKNVKYNLVGVTAGKPDPCGYNEIIY